MLMSNSLANIVLLHLVLMRIAFTPKKAIGDKVSRLFTIQCRFTTNDWFISRYHWQLNGCWNHLCSAGLILSLVVSLPLEIHHVQVVCFLICTLVNHLEHISIWWSRFEPVWCEIQCNVMVRVVSITLSHKTRECTSAGEVKLLKNHSACCGCIEL